MKNKQLFLTLPIPVSTNGYLYPKQMGKYSRLAETAKSKKWKVQARKIINQCIKDQEWETIERGQFLDVHIDYYFNQKGMDPGNYLKTLYDVMENAGVYENDDMAKPQTGIVVTDKFNPRIEVVVYKAEQVGVFKDINDRERFINSYKDSMNERSFNALMKKLDDNRMTENVIFNNNKELMINGK